MSGTETATPKPEDNRSAERNSTFSHKKAGILSVEAVDAPVVITSSWIDDQLSETYTRTKIRPGLLAGVAGIESRRWWEKGRSFASAAAEAGRKALASSGISPTEIDLLISTSVCKPHLEPSVACDVHNQLGLGTGCMNFDVGNACLGFINAIHIASTMIDSGVIKYALIVDGEDSRHVQEATLNRLRNETATSADVFAEFASLTLGSGAVAMVLGSIDENPKAHRVVGGVARAATAHNKLCSGNLEKMETDTAGLLSAGVDLAEDAWVDVPDDFGWRDQIDWYVLHQVSKVHTKTLCERLGIDEQKVPITYPQYGNIGPASVPIALANIQHMIGSGDRILCMGIGSGLNVSCLEILW